MVVKVKILGERSTGTNLLAEIITRNFNCEVYPSSSGLRPEQVDALPGRFEGRWSSRRASKEAIQDHNHFLEVPHNGGWKHAAVTQRFIDEFMLPQSPAVLCIVRHPSEWLRSMHRNPFHGIGHVPRDFSKFIRTPWVASARDELGERLISSPIALLEKKTKSYFELAKRYSNVRVVRYEDLILSTQEVMSSLPIWEARRSDTMVLPIKSARGFGRNRLKTTEYIEKARKTSYTKIDAADRKYVTDQLSGELAELYPI